MIRPSALAPGDVVRLVAPSSPFDRGAFEAGLGVLRELGLRPRFRDDVFARSGFLAGDDARRAAEWREACEDPEARAVWCVRGGYGAMRLLPGLDPTPLLARPKWVIGLSDVTALHAALNQAGLVTLHGPMVGQLARLPVAAREHLRDLLFGAGRAVVEASATVVPGTVEGPLRGGSLTLLSHLCGTPWQPRLAGAVLFLEDVGEKPYKLDRYLTHLALAGALEGVAGIAVGQLLDCDRASEPPGASAAEVLRAHARALGVPAVEGIPAGHDDRNFALTLGAPARLVAPAAGEGGAPRLELLGAAG
ncbi:S66 peptidase family protein [Anaeromyxobacter paludicola]|uniref:S66 peptidase family protein n=1 Tax=Anaeromyxobacter paludicola TaxID=2918171 RepID=UPI0020C09FFE|nr:LD-carboxypeptidase [Anaeromyxobacter paludicola]